MYCMTNKGVLQIHLGNREFLGLLNIDVNALHFISLLLFILVSYDGCDLRLIMHVVDTISKEMSLNPRCIRNVHWYV